LEYGDGEVGFEGNEKATAELAENSSRPSRLYGKSDFLTTKARRTRRRQNWNSLSALAIRRLHWIFEAKNKRRIFATDEEDGRRWDEEFTTNLHEWIQSEISEEPPPRLSPGRTGGGGKRVRGERSPAGRG
jgi:hypothetical protein